MTMDRSELEKFFQIGRAQWPAIALDADVLARHVEELTARAGAPLVEHAADVYLACACAHGARAAVETFESHFSETILRAVARVDRSPEFAEEALQVLRIKLFVKVPPKIADYGGRAKLRTWLATAAVRTSLNLVESNKGRAHEPLEAEPPGVPLDLDVEYVRGRYRQDFQVAMAAAIARLSSRERALLRLHLGERMGIDRLAVVYGAGRSTVARWLVAARSALLEEARRELQARFGVTPSELIDVGADLRSVMEVSLIRLLASQNA
jgi:RNA polymerase sigma-70 factor (ECF subfamily)